MDRINGAGTIDIGGDRRGFIDEDLGVGQEGTQVTALWLNMTQEEMIKVIESAGLVLNPSDWTQLWQALQILGLSAGARSRRWTAVISMTLSSAPGAPAAGDTYLVPTGATGIWAAQVGKIAEWNGTAWYYFTPADGHGISLPDGRVFERIGGAYVEKLALDAQSGKWNYAIAGGTANALTAAIVPAPSAFTDGMSIKVKISTTNTGGSTLNVNGLGPDPVQRPGGGSIQPGDLPANAIVEFVRTAGAWQVAAAAIAPQLYYYNSFGTYTWVCPQYVTRAFVRVWGGGGGGGAGTVNGSAGSGGGAGGYAEGVVAVTPGQSYPVVVGNRGAAGIGGNGGPGGTSSFGSLISCTGGGQGSVSAGGGQAISGNAGTGSGGQFIPQVQTGGQGAVLGGTGLSGFGGASFAGAGVPGSTGTGGQGATPGGGGSGGANGGNGAAGGFGSVIIETF